MAMLMATDPLVCIGWYNGAHILVGHDEEIPEATPTPTHTSALQVLGEEWIPLALRIIMTIEDLAAGPTQAGSLAYILRGTLVAEGGPTLTSSQVNRLFKQEFVEVGYMSAKQELGLDPKTNLPRMVETYQLDRRHRDVKAAINAGPIPLAEGEIRPLRLANPPSDSNVLDDAEGALTT